MIDFKSKCPKCKTEDFHEITGDYGEFMQCIKCGHNNTRTRFFTKEQEESWIKAKHEKNDAMLEILMEDYEEEDDY